MTVDERLLRLEQEHRAYHNLFRKITSWELAHRALLQALLDQPTLDHQGLWKDFDHFLVQLQEEIPPDLRDDTVIQQFVAEVQQRQDGALPHAP